MLSDLIVFSISITLLLTSCSEKVPQEIGVSERQASVPTVEFDSYYKETISGSGRNENGYPFAFHVYEGPNGLRLTRKFEAYESSEAATKRFDQCVRSADKRVVSVDVIDGVGIPVGQRAMLIKRTSMSSKYEFTLVLRIRFTIHIVESNSTETIEDFERQYLRSILTEIAVRNRGETFENMNFR